MKKIVIIFLLLPYCLFADNNFDFLTSSNWSVEGDHGSSRNKNLEYFTFTFSNNSKTVIVTREYNELSEVYYLNYDIYNDSELLLFEDDNKDQPVFVFWGTKDELYLTSPRLTMLHFENLKKIDR
jgi:hypothetical protein